MNVDQGALVTIGLACLGGIVWLVKLDGRVTTQEALHNELKEDVAYIRQRIDEAIKK